MENCQRLLREHDLGVVAVEKQLTSSKYKILALLVPVSGYSAIRSGSSRFLDKPFNWVKGHD